MAKTELYLVDLFDWQKVSIDKTSTRINGKNVECIEIVSYDLRLNCDITYSLWLDKSTAIKFAKTLRTEINKIQEQ